jgi:hypothetical protein
VGKTSPKHIAQTSVEQHLEAQGLEAHLWVGRHNGSVEPRQSPQDPKLPSTHWFALQTCTPPCSNKIMTLIIQYKYNKEALALRALHDKHAYSLFLATFLALVNKYFYRERMLSK